MGESTVDWSKFFQTYFRTVWISWEAERWYVQRSYGNPFACQHWRMPAKRLEAMLTHQLWIACRAAPGETIDRIGFDVDCKPGECAEARNRTYWAVRELMGRERVPLVCRTPSGRGLHVWYRIPETRLEELITGPTSGLLADVLRAADLTPAKGFLELFPQSSHAIRLPLGRRMPILDPETLRPLPHADIGDTFDEAMLWGGLAEIEAWHARVYDDLPEHLRSLPRLQPLRVVPDLHTEIERSASIASRPGKWQPGTELQDLLTRGLSRPGSRFDSEGLVGLAFLLYPECAEPYLGRGPRSDAIIARGIARWLSRNHNGQSKEWTASAEEHRGIEGAIAYWTQRYLQPGKSGETMITRLQRAAARLDPLSQPVRQISDAERQSVLDLVTEFAWPSTLYHFEVWTCSLLRQIRENLAWHLKRGVDLTRSRDPQERIEVQIAAQWMVKWPYASGRGGLKHPYLTYLGILQKHGWLPVARDYVSASLRYPGARRDATGEARHYWVHVPPVTTLREVPIAPWELNTILHARGCRDTRIYRNSVSPDEAYHALYLTRPDQVGSINGRYGSDVGGRIRRMAAAIRTLAAERVESGESLWQLDKAA